MSSTEAPRAPITSHAVWHAADVADRDEWTIEFTDDQRSELASVARRAQHSRPNHRRPHRR